MTWTVQFADAFEPEFEALSEVVQDRLLARLEVLARQGPTLGRPHVDTLKGSAFANMKELRFTATGDEWRAAFAFDPQARGVVLVAARKAGRGEKRFYRELIATADARFKDHLAGMEG